MVDKEFQEAYNRRAREAAVEYRQNPSPKKAMMRATHYYAYRYDEWAEIIGFTIPSLSQHMCYVVMFDDGNIDYRPIVDSMAGYEFKEE